MNGKTIVLDANILIRAVLGQRVRQLLMQHASTVRFFAPDAAFADARTYLPALLQKRGIETAPAMHLLQSLEAIVEPMHLELYAGFQQHALLRIAKRDADDWPILACAMALNCPVWTEDTDFFGAGVATWTTDRIHLFLA